MDGPVLPHYNTPTIPQRWPHPLPDLEHSIAELIDVARDDAERALVACLGYQGMRMHEALSQPVSKIHLGDGSIDIIGKGDKERTIPLTKNGSQYIIPQMVRMLCVGSNRLVEYQDRTARNLITAMGERAGMDRPISSHDLRSTFATVVYRDTKDMRLVQVLLGHADISTTQVYVGLSFERMKEAIG